MARGFINVSTSGSGDVSYYLRESECLRVQNSKKRSPFRAHLLDEWKQIERQEKMGSKELRCPGAEELHLIAAQ